MGLGSGKKLIPDLGVKKVPDPGSGSAKMKYGVRGGGLTKGSNGDEVEMGRYNEASG